MKMETVKKEFERAYNAGLININVSRYVGHAYIKINNSEVALLEKDKYISIYYPFNKDMLDFIFNADWFEKLKNEYNASNVVCYDKDIKKVINNNLYLNTIESTFSDGMDGLMHAARLTLYNLYYIVFAKKQLKFFKKLGLEIKKEDSNSAFNKVLNFTGNTVYVNFKLSKTYDALIDVLEAIHYNYDILRKYPDKLDKLRNIAFYPEVFKYNKKDIEEEGC